jgi:hypothetical protein
MSILFEFKQKLLGTYHNRTQAFSHPQQWAHIFVNFVETDDGNILTRSWYAVESFESPYRETLLKLSISNSNVIIAPINNITKVKSCDISFQNIDGVWFGENLKCIIPEKNMYVSTSIKFDGINYYSRDSGHNLKSNRIIWGKDIHEGYFHFIKQK